MKSHLSFDKTFAYLGMASVLGVLLTGCPQSNSTQSYPNPKVRFAGYTQTCDGIPGNLPDHYGYYLTPQQRQGACTWYLWAGGDPLRIDGSPENARGNPRFWRMAEKRLWLIANTLDLPVDVNMLRYITSTPRDQRFEKLGTLNDPGCKKATKPDAYGLMLVTSDDPSSSGIMASGSSRIQSSIRRNGTRR